MDPIALLRAHRSIRRYRPDSVSDQLLDRLLEAGIRASSSGNMQAYSIVTTRDRALRERLYVAHMEQAMVLEAPVLLTFCADFRRMRRWLALSDAVDGFDDLFSFLVGAIDAVLVSQNVAQLYTSVKYPRADAHAFGRTVRAYLAQQDFMNDA